MATGQTRFVVEALFGSTSTKFAFPGNTPQAVVAKACRNKHSKNALAFIVRDRTGKTVHLHPNAR